MAFDITPYVDMSPKKVRELIRKGVIDSPLQECAVAMHRQIWMPASAV